MAEVKKILGQVALAAAAQVDVYTVPASTQVVGSSVVFCNTSGANRTFKLSVAIAGALDTPSQYLYFNEPLPKDRSYIATIGITLGAGDIIRAEASGVGVSVNVFGVEVS